MSQFLQFHNFYNLQLIQFLQFCIIVILGNQRSIQVSAAPQLPPSYTEPSHKPPTYEEALAQPINNHIYATCPGVIPGYMEDYSYQPPRKYDNHRLNFHYYI